jgi:hypothetical protein
MASGLTSATATSALSRETPFKETPETAETHVEERLKWLWVRIGETLKRLRWTSVGRWWLAWVSGRVQYTSTTDILVMKNTISLYTSKYCTT